MQRLKHSALIKPIIIRVNVNANELKPNPKKHPSFTIYTGKK